MPDEDDEQIITLRLLVGAHRRGCMRAERFAVDPDLDIEGRIFDRSKPSRQQQIGGASLRNSDPLTNPSVGYDQRLIPDPFNVSVFS